jgi:hypothetical protein
MGKKPEDRVKVLLGRLRAGKRSIERGYNQSSEIRHATHKFMRRVEKIFDNLPKSLKWRSFYENGLPILLDICEEVQEASNHSSSTVPSPPNDSSRTR